MESSKVFIGHILGIQPMLNCFDFVDFKLAKFSYTGIGEYEGKRHRESSETVFLNKVF